LTNAAATPEAPVVDAAPVPAPVPVVDASEAAAVDEPHEVQVFKAADTKHKATSRAYCKARKAAKDAGLDQAKMNEAGKKAYSSCAEAWDKEHKG
jgi:hypothetical protein